MEKLEKWKLALGCVSSLSSLTSGPISVQFSLDIRVPLCQTFNMNSKQATLHRVPL